jgi:hypothetical protein
MTGTGDLAAQIQAFDAAVGRMASFQQDWRTASPEEFAALRGEMRALEHLVHHGDEFLRGWARMLGLDTGYTATGLPGGMDPSLASPRVDLEG